MTARLALVTVALVRIGNMTLFGRTSGYYLFWTGFVYFWVGIYLALQHSNLTHYATMTWLFVVSIPLWCPPVARYFNMEPMMFNWFGNSKDAYSKEETGKVYNFPEPKLVPPAPPATPPETPAKIFYRIGATDQNRVSFSMGHMEITMNKEGVQNLIDQLSVFRDQLHEEN